MKKVISLFSILFIATSFSYSQETKEEANNKSSNLSLSVAVKNRHLWRCGQGFNGFNVQSTMAYTYKFLKFGVWGGYELAPSSYSELDLFVEANFLNYFTFAVYDFYMPYELGGRTLKDFSNFKSSPNHIIDVFLNYSGPEKIPVGALVATYVYGGGDRYDNGKQKFSTYIEVNYNLVLKNNSNIKFYAGATTSNESAFSAQYPKFDKLNNLIAKERPTTDNDFNVIGVGTKYTKKFKIGQFNSNVSGEFLYNTNVDAVYLAFSFVIAF